jgi:hypothetical protein
MKLALVGLLATSLLLLAPWHALGQPELAREVRRCQMSREGHGWAQRAAPRPKREPWSGH